VRLLDKAVAHSPTATKAWSTPGSNDDAAIHGAVPGIDVGYQTQRHHETLLRASIQVLVGFRVNVVRF